MQVGIVGIPYSGKSTIFSTLLKHKAAGEPGSKLSAEKGIVHVPDKRLDHLTDVFKPKKQVNTTIEYIKVPGLEKKQSSTEGLPAQFLANLKTVDVLMVVVRNFENPYYPHPFERIDPRADIKYINSEFLLSDLVIIENRIIRLEKQILKTQSDRDKKELHVLRKAAQILEEERPLREMPLTDQEFQLIKSFQFITLKPVLYVLNIAEQDIGREEEIENDLSDLVTQNCAMTSLSAEIEKEISELDGQDALTFMKDLGIAESALHKLIRVSYALLGLISFFTIGDDECRSWTIRKNTNAQKAAGTIHSDMEKGFIRAEVVHYDDFIRMGSMAACKEKGLLRLEGKEYQVEDGDILNIRFNV
ncbi:MAG: redox-regulated ATPase YchF [Caldithrix sp.]|nr:redox-regulated ATPase YchF [Caldithrix sp.]